MSETYFCRSKEKIKATIGGEKTELAFCLKDKKYAQSFWYFIKLPCGGWKEFDIRKVLEVDQSEWMQESIEALRESWETALSRVAERLKDVEFAAISTLHNN